MKYTSSYLVYIQFLGFRFHGWQKQQNAKTVHEMIDKTLPFVFNHQDFKTLGIGRTDSKVSAYKYIFQLFLNEKLEESSFLEKINSNFPSDIKALSVKKTRTSFNIIQEPKIKEYRYYFSFGEKNHPFAAPFMVGFDEMLDVNLMCEGAKLFEGEHYFHKYCTKPSEHTTFKRRIDFCKIVENTTYTANFFPKKNYVLKVKGAGFLRYQIRLMMGALLQLGRGEVTLENIKTSLLEDNDRRPLKIIAPSSGLQLYDIEFIN